MRKCFKGYENVRYYFIFIPQNEIYLHVFPH